MEMEMEILRETSKEMSLWNERQGFFLFFFLKRERERKKEIEKDTPHPHPFYLINPTWPGLT